MENDQSTVYTVIFLMLIGVGLLEFQQGRDHIGDVYMPYSCVCTNDRVRNGSIYLGIILRYGNE